MTDLDPSVVTPALDGRPVCPPRLRRLRRRTTPGKAGGRVLARFGNSVGATSSNLRFLADDGRVTPNGRHWRWVAGTSVRDPRRASHMIGGFGEAQVSRVDSHLNWD